MSDKKKVGDVVSWAIVNCEGDVVSVDHRSRSDARDDVQLMNKLGIFQPYRIAKVVLAK